MKVLGKSERNTCLNTSYLSTGKSILSKSIGKNTKIILLCKKTKTSLCHNYETNEKAHNNVKILIMCLKVD
jgi:hypothetical protein